MLLFEGMHRKSLEAAEALKDDSGGSDRDDEHSKASDVSSNGNPTKPTGNQKSKRTNASDASPVPVTNSFDSMSKTNRHSVTPTSTAAQAPHITTSPVNTANSQTGATPLPVHHLIESKSMLSSPTHPSFHHDGDTEAFRWVDYNRDPISFIRCALFFKAFLYFSYSI